MPTKATNAATSIALPSLRDLVDAGAHFGHRRSRSHPGSRQYVYTIRDRVLVVNLEDTRRLLGEAAQAARSLAAEGKTFLFVGTKPQAAETVAAMAAKAGMPSVTSRWLGGTLTNFPTIRKNIQKLLRLEELLESEEAAQFTKKERVVLTRQREKLRRTIGGIQTLDRTPDVLVIIDLDEEAIAAQEARVAGIPVIALVDTNADPDSVQFPIPGNDDSRRTIEIVLGVLVDAIVEGAKSAPAPEVGTKVAKSEPKPQEKGEATGETRAERMAEDTGTEAGAMSLESRDEPAELAPQAEPAEKKSSAKKAAITSKPTNSKKATA